MYTKILGTGSYFPKEIRTNEHLEKIISITDEWIVSRTGIKERRIADQQENVCTMGAEAAKKALEMANIEVNKIDLIIVATTSSTYAFPSTACRIQRILGVKCCAAFDVSAACAGFSYALSICDQYIRNGTASTALIIGSDMLSKSLNPKDKNTMILFGDGAGAIVVVVSKKPGILSTHLCSDGRFEDFLMLERQEYKKEHSPSYIKMEGNEVFKIAVKKLTEILEKTLKKNGLDRNRLDWLVPHQSNLRIIQAISKKLKISMKKIIVTLDKYGNTSAASVPTALDQAVRDGRIKKGQKILLESFGGGFVWGSALVIF
ncbi:beta-ketoacyl-ACP synthase III [Candidatus Riesia pediculicola]|uniref:Beta-ketoacyl-[acyl-carrier-protein] synthase III n=1 Tax=Riesia pediculicola (strain USDA) TaxID=515618 RepID=D4G8I2_RIEPU|nr:beta-ketoacyl-ACP synthase III [Candidatus Riesia pediculicola]ADD79553.1 3-oxoacyl-[acyl-carrier-protein] synthase 3 [Candidatus Riesia pediculicola USDA]ARC53861.1 3-oxoacyl-ACP synthase [Candidatus Riesia pediculicola]QOJ86492.1 ketoacyl-ACP synthase III [Candidatus Riesia pediculicola]